MSKKITTQVTYRVPEGHYCNLLSGGLIPKPTKELCRFCVKDGKGYRCALYNTPLEIVDTAFPKKDRDCERAIAGFRSTVRDVEEQGPTIAPKDLIKASIEEFEKARRKLLAQGYPEAIASRAAKEYVLGGN